MDLVERLFSGTGSSYDIVVRCCTVNLDGCWKKRILAGIPPRAMRVLDHACGTGILTCEIARRFPRCKVVGVELRREYLTIAIEKAQQIGLQNVHFVQGRAEDVFLKSHFDCITSSYLAKYAELKSYLGQVKAMLRPGGVLITHDFTAPTDHLWRRIWMLYFRILQSLGARIFPEWQVAFHLLPILLERTDWVPSIISLLKAHAFWDISVQPLFMKTAAIVTAKKAEEAHDA
jgi:demethylmenaquinone methyltransferase/2-methoxy-6-polyprenyl-1,4-benzoquinol methylase